MSTSDFEVVSWSSVKTDAASTDRRSLEGVDPGNVPNDRRPDDVFGDESAVPDDDGTLEIVELICHNVAAGKGLGQRQGVDPDRAFMCEISADEGVHECGLRSDRSLDQIIKLIDDSWPSDPTPCSISIVNVQRQAAGNLNQVQDGSVLPTIELR
jgi:hypothetical protein